LLLMLLLLLLLLLRVLLLLGNSWGSPGTRARLGERPGVGDPLSRR